MKTEGSTDGTKPYAIKRLPTGGVEIQMSDMRSMKDVMSLAKELIAPTLQTMLDAKLTEHLGYEKYDPKGRNSGNSRNGYSPKTLKTSFGPASLLVPRDRSGTFEPIAVRKYETIDNDVEERIISMYAKGMTTRDIERHMQDLYGVEVSAGMISAITDKVMPLVQEWQSRPLSAQYVLVYLDGIHFKIRDTGKIVNKYSYTILGVNTEGKREILGLWRDCSKITGLLSSGPRLLSGSARLVTPCAWRFAPHGPRPPCGHLLVCPHPREALWPLARATMAPFHRLRRRGPPRVSANDHCLLQGGRPERGEARTARRAAVPPPPPRRPFGQCRLPPAASIAPRVPRLPARASLPSLGQPAGAAPPPPAGPVPPALGAHEGPRRPPGGPPLCPACGLAGGVRGGRGAWTALRPWRGRGGPGLARPGDGAPPRVDARLAPLARAPVRRPRPTAVPAGGGRPGRALGGATPPRQGARLHGAVASSQAGPAGRRAGGMVQAVSEEPLGATLRDSGADAAGPSVPGIDGPVPGTVRQGPREPGRAQARLGLVVPPPRPRAASSHRARTPGGTPQGPTRWAVGPPRCPPAAPGEGQDAGGGRAVWRGQGGPGGGAGAAPRGRGRRRRGALEGLGPSRPQSAAGRQETLWVWSARGLGPTGRPARAGGVALTAHARGRGQVLKTGAAFRGSGSIRARSAPARLLLTNKVGAPREAAPHSHLQTKPGSDTTVSLWIGEHESAKFWLGVLTEIKNRGVEDILIASVDGLTGFSDAIHTVFPHADVQQCIVHQIRNTVKYVPHKHKKEFCKNLRNVYTAPTEEAGLTALEAVKRQWPEYAVYLKSWENKWHERP